MNKGTVPTLIVAGLLSVTMLAGCADTNDDAQMNNSTSESTEQAVNPDITPEQNVFLDELLATPLPQDEATTRIEEAGYTWRLGTIDGEPQAVTMDYRIDRLTLTTQDGLVIDGMWG